VAWGLGVELTELFDVIKAYFVTSNMEHSVEKGAIVAARENEAITVNPFWMFWVSNKMVLIKNIEGWSDIKRHAWVAAVGLVDLVDYESTDSTDCERILFIEVTNHCFSP
jgi:hypothetical protein